MVLSGTQKADLGSDSSDTVTAKNCLGHSQRKRTNTCKLRVREGKPSLQVHLKDAPVGQEDRGNGWLHSLQSLCTGRRLHDPAGGRQQHAVK